MERKLPPADEAKHAFYGVQINDNFTVHTTGDTLKNRNVEWVLNHFPQGVKGNENDGFDGDQHQSESYSSYRDAVKDARNNYCVECEEFSN